MPQREGEMRFAWLTVQSNPIHQEQEPTLAKCAVDLRSELTSKGEARGSRGVVLEWSKCMWKLILVYGVR